MPSSSARQAEPSPCRIRAAVRTAPAHRSARSPRLSACGASQSILSLHAQLRDGPEVEISRRQARLFKTKMSI
jgi:hypothetical protein